MYVENPKEGIKNHDLSKNTTFLLSLACIMRWKEISLRWRCLFLPTNCRGLFWWDWAASCGNGLGCLLRWWALVFLSKGAGVGSIVTQLGPICAQTYAMSAMSKFTASRIVADKLWRAGLLQTSYGRLDCCRQVMAVRYNNN